MSKTGDILPETPPSNPAPRCLRLAEVLRRVPICESQLRNLMRAGEFPQSFHLGRRAVAWLEDEVSDWVAKRAATRVVFRVPAKKKKG